MAEGIIEVPGQGKGKLVYPGSGILTGSVGTDARVRRVSPLQQVKNAYAKVLYMRADDTMIIDYVMSVYTAMLHPQLLELVWGYIIRPASSGKTEALRIFNDWHKCIGIDEPTAAAFQSAYVSETGEDMSLLLQLPGKMLIIKDMSILMQSRMGEAAKIMSVLRSAHDQYTAKASGTLGVKEYKAMFGLLIATTDVVDAFTEQNQQLGERLVAFRINRTTLDLDQRQFMLDRAEELGGDKELKRAQIRATAHEQFDVIQRGCMERSGVDGLPRVPEDIRKRVKRAGDLLAVLRTCPVAGVGGQSEMGYRVVAQLMNLGYGHAIADGRKEWDQSDVDLVMRVIFDTLAKVRSRVLYGMFMRGKQRHGESLEQIAKRAKTIPPKVAEMFVQFIHSGIVECISDGYSTPLFKLSAHFYHAIDRCGFFDGRPRLGD